MTDPIVYRPILNRDRRILIVDPELKLCETLSLVFRLEGYQTSFVIDRPSLEGHFAPDHRRPDTIIASDDLDGLGGLQLLRMVKKLRAAIPVYLMVSEPDVEAAARLMRAGAYFVVKKPVDADALAGLVAADLRKDIHLGEFKASGGRSIEIGGFNSLSDRERQILSLVANGRTNREAGEDLGISPRTVEIHRKHIMEKLHARNTADLMRIVLTS